MIVYKNTDWLEAFWNFHTGETARSLLKRLFWVAVYVTVITYLQLTYLDLRLADTPASFLSAMGILLSLLLLFRTNTAYDRFYSGRIAWGTLVNTCRNLAILYNAILPDSHREDRVFFTKMITNFPVALKNHLRDSRNADELDFDQEHDPHQWLRDDHLPAAIAGQLRNRTEDLYRKKLISEAQLINLNAPLQMLMEVAGICERIKSTPIPFSYNLFIKLFITIYVMIIPFTVIAPYGYMTIPVVVITSYVLIGLEMIGEEIEDPFGLERNDLPLAQLSQLIRVNVHEIMQIHLPQVEKKAAQPDFAVVS